LKRTPWAVGDREEFVRSRLDDDAPALLGCRALDVTHLGGQVTVPITESVQECRRPLDVGHQHRREPGREIGLIDGPCRTDHPLGSKLTADEAHRHDLELLGRVPLGGTELRHAAGVLLRNSTVHRTDLRLRARRRRTGAAIGLLRSAAAGSR
jgi:hypothetical protein